MSTVVRGETTWSTGLLELAGALALAPQADVRRRTAELWTARPRPEEPDVHPEFFRLTVSVLWYAAEDMAVALGTTPLELLEFCKPSQQNPILQGKFGIKRRLDRVLGGGTLASLEARQPMRIEWMGPGIGRFFVLRGEAWLNERAAGANELLLAPVGAAVHIATDGCVLVRNPAASHLLETARNAGLDLDQLIVQAAGLAVTVKTSAGLLALGEDHAVLAQRRLRLSKTEAAVLRRLAAAGGAVVPRAELQAAAQLKTEKSLEYVLVQLRDKLGDGLITTVYGSGCALETR